MRLCQSVAHHLWSEVAAAPLAAQTPLAELTAAVSGRDQSGRAGDQGFPGRSAAGGEAWRDAAAGHDSAGRNRGLAARPRRGHAGLSHVAVAAVLPDNGPAHEIPLPGGPDPSDLCALSALAGVTIDGAPALWIEQSGAFSNAFGQSTIVIAALDDGGFAPPCEVTVDYAITDRVTHALCPELDCVPLIQVARRAGLAPASGGERRNPERWRHTA